MGGNNASVIIVSMVAILIVTTSAVAVVVANENNESEEEVWCVTIQLDKNIDKTTVDGLISNLTNDIGGTWNYSEGRDYNYIVSKDVDKTIIVVNLTTQFVAKNLTTYKVKIDGAWQAPSGTVLYTGTIEEYNNWWVLSE